MIYIVDETIGQIMFGRWPECVLE